MDSFEGMISVFYHFICMLLTNFIFLLSSSRAVGYRFGPHLEDTVPVLINYCTTASENDEELREYSLQVLCVAFSLIVY